MLRRVGGGWPASGDQQRHDVRDDDADDDQRLDPVARVAVNTVPTTTALSGSRKIVTMPAAMPTATATVIGNPGRCDIMIPAAAPRNIAGKVGPPRKLPSENAYATPLATSSSASAPSE